MHRLKSSRNCGKVVLITFWVFNRSLEKGLHCCCRIGISPVVFIQTLRFVFKKLTTDTAYQICFPGFQPDPAEELSDVTHVIGVTFIL